MKRFHKKPKANAKPQKREVFDLLLFFASFFAPSCIALFILAITVAGCSKSNDPPQNKPIVPAGNGIVRGIVRFVGTKPTSKTIGGDCCPGSTPVFDESLVINDNNTLKDVIVYVKYAPNVASEPLQDKVLAQINCQYVPHVLGIHTGQNLIVTSHDATIHNIHIEADANPSQDFSETLAASHSVQFALPELVRFKCDVHPWMTAYAYVFDHPFFAVTGSDGRFEINHLPAGTYTLVAWQEKLEPQEMQVTVGDKPSEVQFEYHGQ